MPRCTPAAGARARARAAGAEFGAAREGGFQQRWDGETDADGDADEDERFEARTPTPAPAAGPPAPPPPRKEDAYAYLSKIQAHSVGEHEHLYHAFLNAMRAFKGGETDAESLIRTVKAMFAHAPQLLDGFEAFLPPGFTESLR